MVFLVSSDLVTVPSGALVTVFSVDLTVPSLLTLLLSVLETSRSHPISKNDNARADIATQVTIIRFFIMFLHSPFFNRGSAVAVVCLIGEAVWCPFLPGDYNYLLDQGFYFVREKLRDGLDVS